ncbi:MAG: DNA primase [Eubacteriales bacterium]|nr:DNA primase [Eubacteriales bacterium]
MYYSEDLVEEVRSRNDIVDVISGYVKLQRKGAYYFGLCPFHNEKSPSFSVSPSKQIYHCFGCGAGGDVFTFLREYENFTFQEAMQSLADRAGIVLPVQEESARDRQEKDLRGRILEVNKMAAKYFYYQLRTENGKAAMKYLQDRQLSEETIRSFGLGFANKYSNDLYRYLKDKGISDELLAQSGLMNVDEKQGMYDKFWNRVIFPIMDVNNRVIGFGGRVMGDGKPKYLNSPETKVFEKSRNLYGLNVAKRSRSRYYLVCEGYMDVISLHQAGFTNAVASLGTALTSQHAGLLRRYTEEVVLTYDSDDAGIKAALRAIPLLKEAGINTRVLSMQPYKDPDEFIKALGAEEFQKRIDAAQNSFLFETDLLQKNYNMADPTEKTAFHEALAKKLMTFEQELERENYIEAAARRYHISFENLRKLVNRMAMQGMNSRTVTRRREETAPTGSGTAKPKKEGGIVRSQKLMLTWLIEYPKLYQSVKPYLHSDDFTTELLQKVAEQLFSQYEESGSCNPAKIISSFEELEDQKEAAALFHATLETSTKAELEKAVRETLMRLVAHGLEQRSAKLDPTDMAGLQKLIQDKKRISQIGQIRLEV